MNRRSSLRVQAKRLLATPGFVPPLLAFVTSIAVTNVVGAFMDLVPSKGNLFQHRSTCIYALWLVPQDMLSTLAAYILCHPSPR